MPFIDYTRVRKADVSPVVTPTVAPAPVAPVAPVAPAVTPASIAASIPRWFFPAITAMAFAVTSLGGYLAWEHFRVPDNAGPSSTLSVAYKAYHDSEGSALNSLANQIRSGSLSRSGAQSDREAIGKALKQHSDPLAAALNGYFDGHCDAKGNLTSPTTVADDFAAAAKALGAK